MKSNSLRLGTLNGYPLEAYIDTDLSLSIDELKLIINNLPKREKKQKLSTQSIITTH